MAYVCLFIGIFHSFSATEMALLVRWTTPCRGSIRSYSSCCVRAMAAKLSTSFRTENDLEFCVWICKRHGATKAMVSGSCLVCVKRLRLNLSKDDCSVELAVNGFTSSSIGSVKHL